MILCILKAVLVWVIMAFVSMNLFGLVIRGLFWSAPVVDVPVSDELRNLLARESRKLTAGNAIMTFVSIVLAGGFLYSLLYFWNIGLAAAGAILMIWRLPDFLWEIRTGRKLSRGDMPKGLLNIMPVVLLLGALPLIWYSLCKCES